MPTYDYSVTTSNNSRKSVQDPNFRYESLAPVWKRNRAVIGGQSNAREFDKTLRKDGTNMLVPFSSTMTAGQYNWYRSEGELPGFTSQFVRTVIGGMLRKEPIVELPDEAPEEALDWIRNRFTADDQSLIGFLQDALYEEMNTSRAWVCINYPGPNAIESPDGGPPEPFPILLSAESIINWQMGIHPFNGTQTMTQLIVRMYVQEYRDNEFHPNWIDRVWVHELDEAGYYRIRVFEKNDDGSGTSTGVVNGQVQQDYAGLEAPGAFQEVLVETDIMRNGERLDFIPIYPLNGQVEPMEPQLTSIVDREVGLYNKVSRRNHLLYGAATYTPVLKSSVSDEDKEDIVSAGLGAWLFLDREDNVDILQTPSDALSDLEKSIEVGTEDLARMGIRMLAPDTAESGIALEIRNSGQTAQLSSLSRMVSNSLRQIITQMVNWRYNLEIREEDLRVVMSTDLTPVPIGPEFIRLVSEFYQGGLIPRGVFIETLKANDILPSDYDDEEGMEEVDEDPAVVSARERFEITENPNNQPEVTDAGN